MRSALSTQTQEALARTLPAAGHCRAALYDGLMRFAQAPRPPMVRLLRAFADEPPPLSKATDTLPRSRCDRRMELRAAFLARGSLATPRSGYHLEFVLDGETLADRVVRLLQSEDVAPLTMRRAGRIVVYLKSVDAIVTVLGAIGAHAAVLQIEGTRAMKETKNRVHRLVNTEAANVVRAAAAGATQREALAFLAEAYGLRNLSPALREAAQLRIAYPDETLSELGRRASPPVGKATINGRIAALLRLVARLRSA